MQVEDFGAVGDGVALDHAAIQRAIAAAGSGGVVEFKAGRTYVQCNQLVPLAGQTFIGNGAVLKRCAGPVATLLVDAQVGDTFVVVDRPEVFRVNQVVSPVKGAGGFPDGESLIAHLLTSISGNTLSFSRELGQDYPAGSLVTAVFDQLNTQAQVENVTVDGLVFDGNRSENEVYLSWTRNNAMRTAYGTTVRNSRFRNMPGNALTVQGTNVLIDRNHFEDLDGAIAHLSGNDPVNGSTVTLSNNTVARTNRDALRMNHTEGVITISAFNNSVRVIGNEVRDAQFPFIANFHENMRDWLISDNIVFDTAGIFYARNSIGTALEQIEFADNLFVNVGQSDTLRSPVGDLIRSFVFRSNRVIGGTLRFSGLIDGVIADNTVKVCGEDPMTISGSSNVRVENNALSTDYCVLSLAARGEPALVDEPGGPVNYIIDVSNAADPADSRAAEGVTVTSVSLLAGQPAAQCSPALPATILRGESVRCSMELAVSGTIDQEVSQSFIARGTTSNARPVTTEGSASITIRDGTPPQIDLLGVASVEIEFGEAYVESGATAVDNHDGDLTHAIVMSTNLNEKKVGRYVVTYSAADRAGNIGEAQRTVRVIDRVAPTLTLLGSTPLTMLARSPFLDPGASAIDNADGDISGAIRVDTRGLDASRPGEYVVRYDVSDTSGNAAQSVTRTVVVMPRPGGGGKLGVEVALLLIVLLANQLLDSRRRSRRIPRVD